MCLLLAYAALWCLPSKAKGMLPKTATDVHEKKTASGMDIRRVLKAKITPEEFEVYRQKMGYLPAPENLKAVVLWPANWPGPWWDPSPSKENNYYDRRLGNWVDPNFTSTDYRVMKYENGYVYYLYEDI